MTDYSIIFGLNTIDGHDLAIIKHSNFIEFLKFVSETQVAAFSEYQKLICPSDLTSSSFKSWIVHCLSVSKQKQNDLCATIQGLAPSRLSKFLNSEAEISFDEKVKIRDEIRRDLIAKRLFKP